MTTERHVKKEKTGIWPTCLHWRSRKGSFMTKPSLDSRYTEWQHKTFHLRVTFRHIEICTNPRYLYLCIVLLQGVSVAHDFLRMNLFICPSSNESKLVSILKYGGVDFYKEAVSTTEEAFLYQPSVQGLRAGPLPFSYWPPRQPRCVLWTSTAVRSTALISFRASVQYSWKFQCLVKSLFAVAFWESVKNFKLLFRDLLPPCLSPKSFHSILLGCYW